MDTSLPDTNSAGSEVFSAHEHDIDIGQVLRSAGVTATASSASQRLSRVQRIDGDEELVEEKGNDADAPAPMLSKAMSRASSTAASVLAAVTS